VVVLLGVRVFYLFVRYILGSTTTQRFHVESAALIFLAVGLIVRLVRSRRSEPEPTMSTTLPRFLWVFFCGLAVALYWPALTVGFLSDDFVLLTYASSWNIGPVTASLFRPIPLFIWAVVLQAGSGSTLLHLLNVLLHGANAYLTTRLVQGWTRNRTWSVLAGLLVLTAPLAPEAVVWLSGVFDVLAATLVLTCILIARRYERHLSPATRIQFVAVGIAAAGSKETAAVAVGLVLIDAWARRVVSRTLLIDTGILAAIVGVFGFIRLASAFGLVRPPLTKYVAQRAIFGSFGGLAVPWHIDVIHRFSWMPLIGVVILVYLLIVFFLDPDRSSQRSKLAVAAALWVLVSILPVFPILFIGPDLQQSRYLYLPMTGWAALIAVIAGAGNRSYLKPLSYAAVVGLIVIAACGTVLHLRPWKEAARLRGMVEASAVDLQMSKCPTATLSDLPDSVDGAYVFRNGGTEAFARDLHVNAVLGDSASGRCVFRWSDSEFSFVQ